MPGVYLKDWLLESAKLITGNTLVDPALIDCWIPNCHRIEQLPGVTAEMLDRGFGEEDIEKVLGGNFMSAFRMVWL